MLQRIRAEQLRPKELKIHSVWRFINDDMSGDTFVTPDVDLPAKDLDNRIVGTRVSLSNGYAIWAVLGNVDVGSIQSTQQFISITLFQGESLFHLARYFDPDRHRNGPEQLARWLQLPIGEVFPITYDISTVVIAPSECLKGEIPIQPSKLLTAEERLELILNRRL